MESPAKEKMEKGKQLVEPRLCNKDITKVKPIITDDSKYIICGNGKEVLLYKLKSGALDSVFCKHKQNIIALFLNKKDNSQVISCSSCRILIWNYKNHNVLKKIVMPENMQQVFVFSSLDKVLYTTTVTKKNKEMLCSYDVKEKSKNEMFKISSCNKSFCVSNCSKMVVAINKNALIVHNNNTATKYTFDNQELTCVTMKRKGYTVATGDRKGQIVIWNHVHKGVPVCTKLHWHNNCVNDVMFMNDGFYMVSGGQEGVMVVWQLETQHKSFIPRLEGAIQHIFQTPNGQDVGVVLNNNILKLVTLWDSKLKKAIKHLSPAVTQSSLCYDTSRNCIVLNGRPYGTIQFYQPEQDSVKLTLDVIGENLVSSLEERQVYPSRVEAIALSKDSAWMATVEVHETHIIPTSRKLKFWKFTDGNKNFTLNTVVEPVHKGVVTALHFRPTQHPALVSASSDGDLKLWQLVTEQDRPGEECWQLEAMRRYADQPCKCASFSEDGSLLALLFNEVTLWNAENLNLEKDLNWNNHLDPIVGLTFCHQDSSHYLVAYTCNTLITWDIRSLDIVWRLACDPLLLVSDPHSRHFAALVSFHKQQQEVYLYLFDPAHANPVATVANCPSKITHALFTPHTHTPTEQEDIWATVGSLHLLTRDTKIYKVCKKEALSLKKIKETTSENISNFQEIFGAFKKEQLNSEGSDEIHRPSNVQTIIDKLSSTPSHVLPSTDSMCKLFLKSLLLAKHHRKEEAAKEDDSESEDSEEDSDSDAESDVAMDETIAKDDVITTKVTEIDIPTDLYSFTFLDANILA